jgi:ABC-2 type transport system permease protein
MKTQFLSWRRFVAITAKEFVQMRRDRMTFAIMLGIPLLQLILFGFAINTDPHNLPTTILSADHGPMERAIVAAMRQSSYFEFVGVTESEADARDLLKTGGVQFVLTIPAGFQRDMLRGEQPALLLEADATDPAATGNAVSAMGTIVERAVSRELSGPLSSLQPQDLPFELRIQSLYNPERVTRYNIVPGLMGVVLTMTLVIVTSLAITRERERGTMEVLLSTPVQPLEVMFGKILPYIVVGYIQAATILMLAKLLFNVPVLGSITLLLVVSLPFIAANLGVGLTFSTLARNQLQATQMSFFFFLPSILLSGFMFPFRGMPVWAQYLGEILPLTHYLRIVRGIVLKGNGFTEIAPQIWPIVLFLFASLGLGLLRYRRTLD